MSAFPSAIAIDGPVASGKTTVGQAIARRLGYRFVDTGLMYRAVTLAALRRRVPLDDADALTALAASLTLRIDDERLLTDGEDVTDELRSAEVNEAVSVVSQVAGVRRALVDAQRQIAAAGRGGVVMVGRDIGTNVLPEAVKVYLEASEEERVRRRHREAAAQGASVTAESIRWNLALRDRLDSERETNPLRAAPDAVRLVTDGLSVEEVVERIIAILGGKAA